MRVLAAAAAALWLAGHSPYRQWDVYRRARLVLLATAAGMTLSGIVLRY